MKKIFLFVLLFTIQNIFAWNQSQGKVQRVWIDGWFNKPNIICFQINGTYFAVRSDATEQNKNRIMSILLSAQTSNLTVVVDYHPDLTGGGQACEVGNNAVQAYGVHTVSLAPEIP